MFVLPTLLNGCSSPIKVKRVSGTFNIPGVGTIDFNLEELELGGGGSPPPGLSYQCSGTFHNQPFKLYVDPATGDQWVEDSDGDFHPVIGQTIDCPPVVVVNNPTQFMNIDQDMQFSFDESTDSAFVQFIYPSAMQPRYVPASQMPFNTAENVIYLFNGDLSISYSGTINDVLGSMWVLGFDSIEYSDKVDGTVSVEWGGSDMNSVYIDTDFESRTVVFEWTNLGNLND